VGKCSFKRDFGRIEKKHGGIARIIQRREVSSRYPKGIREIYKDNMKKKEADKFIRKSLGVYTVEGSVQRHYLNLGGG